MRKDLGIQLVPYTPSQYNILFQKPSMFDNYGCIFYTHENQLTLSRLSAIKTKYTQQKPNCVMIRKTFTTILHKHIKNKITLSTAAVPFSISLPCHFDEFLPICPLPNCYSSCLGIIQTVHIVPVEISTPAAHE